MSANWNENENLRSIYAKPESSTGVSGICATLLISAGFLVALVALCSAEECKPVAEYQATHDDTVLIESKANFSAVVTGVLIAKNAPESVLSDTYLLVGHGVTIAVVPVRNGNICSGLGVSLDASSSADLIGRLERQYDRSRA